jgi:hypothetical protein
LIVDLIRKLLLIGKKTYPYLKGSIQSIEKIKRDGLFE